MSQTINIDFEAMRNIDITTVDRDTLADIRDIKIKTELPQREKIMDFIRQSKGQPYIHKYKGMVIQSGFAETEATLDDQLVRCFVSP